MQLKNKVIHILLIFLSFTYYGCKVSMEQAREEFDKHNYAVAADKFKTAMKGKDATKRDKIEGSFKAAESFRFNHDSKNALKYYARAERYGMKEPVVIYRQAEMLMEQGQYNEAIKKFKEFKKIQPTDKEVDNLIEGAELALKCADKKTRYIIENFKVANQSKVDDRVPRYANKKKTMIMFTSDRPEGESKKQHRWTGRSFEDIYVVTKKGKRGRLKWQKPILVEGFTEYNEGAMTFNRRFNTMYITQCNGANGKGLDCKIYEAKKRGTKWELSPKYLPFCQDSFSYGHPALSPDGKKIYFVSDMPGSLQNEDKNNLERTKDIWVSNYVRRGRTWGPPINLGPAVNTTGNEMFPYVHEDGTLYFSSDGHPTLGGLDIFHTTQLSDNAIDWAKPTNMECPVNSKSDDFGIILDTDKEHGFFSSDRARGDDDIYEFSMTPLVILLKGTVTDCDSKFPLQSATVVISNNIDSSKIRLKTDERGFYETALKPGVKYEIHASKREDYYYDAESKFVSTEGIEMSTEFVKDFCMNNQCDDVFILPIYYGLDSADIRSESKRVLNGLVDKLKRYPKMKVELGSHTDCRASYDYNIDLSQRRADSAVNYIISQGINPFRLEARGYGESQLTNECECEDANITPCDEDEHQKNRRTTVTVVNCKYEFKWSNPEVQDTNKVAIEGGPVYSKVIIQARKDYIIKHGQDYEKVLEKADAERKAQRDKAEAKAKAEMYDILPITQTTRKSGTVYYLTGYMGRKKIKFIYDADKSRVEIPQRTVEQLMRSKIIAKSDFSDGREKIKLTDGTKLSSRSFKMKELKIGDIIFENVRCKMVADTKKALIGNRIFNDYEGTEIKGDKLYLKKIKDDE
jgi:peptidoglycan-associated lipoprotein